MFLAGARLFIVTSVTGGESKLSVVDVSTPERPREIGSVEALGFGDKLVLGRHLYVVSPVAIGVYDLSGDGVPQALGTTGFRDVSSSGGAVEAAGHVVMF